MPTNKGKSRAEIFDNEVNDFIIISWHKDSDIAVINANTISKSRKCQARVISEGKIIYTTEVKS